MNIDSSRTFDFDDVLIRPARSAINSRADATLTRKFVFRNGVVWEGFPLIAANMDATGTMAMARALLVEKALVSLHKFYSAEQLIAFFGSGDSANAFYTMGIGHDDIAKFHAVRGAVSLEKISVDVANGYIDRFVEHVRMVRELCPDSILMVGAVATAEMTRELIAEGADIVRVGIGSGSACTTRLVAGVGVPQLSAVAECASAARESGTFICSDGGCRRSGDVAKAFGGGADFVMLGGMLAGHDEGEGEWKYETIDGTKRRTAMFFHGMSSAPAMKLHYGEIAHYRAPEGETVEVPYRGGIAGTICNIKGGVSSAMTYIGAASLEEMPRKTRFILNSGRP